jgi:ectoine hydroxylase-related dioxygenase (phytanoyl-CoA dioxygenase family)
MEYSLKNFQENGFCIIKNFFSKEDSLFFKNYTENWIYDNILNAIDINLAEFKKENFQLEKYKDYQEKFDINHSKVAAQKFRYIEPPAEIKSILRSEKVMEIFKEITSKNNFEVWRDPGFGWLGYRIIRPISNDGYPASCKNWGFAAGVYSAWVPIAGCNDQSSIRLLKGSHKKEYQKYLPENSKFTKGEYRLAEEIDQKEYIRLDCNLGDIIIYHPAMIHSEDTSDKSSTRTNLEYRFSPL